LRKFSYLPLPLTVLVFCVVLGCGRSRALAEEGLLRLEQGKQTSALELFDRALRGNSQEALALYGKGILLSEEQITEEIALTMLKQAVQQNDLKEKYRVRAFLRIAEISVKRNDKEETLQNLSKISGTTRVIDSQTLRRMTALYLQLKEKDRAREAMTAFLETHPADEETEYLLLRLYVTQLKDLKAAGKLCAKVEWQKSRLPKYLLNCTRVLAALNDYTTAITLADLYLKREGTVKEVNELRESILRKRGKFEPVEADF
jgi:tetratricopeptide (TPR) repeat protein